MKKLILTSLVLITGSLFTPALLAADEAQAAAKTGDTKAEAKKSNLDENGKQKAKKTNAIGTNVIGTQEAPTVMNIVPWKDREIKMEKKEATSATLSRVLKPLDRDELMREVQYFDLLEQSRQ